MNKKIKTDTPATEAKKKESISKKHVTHDADVPAVVEPELTEITATALPADKETTAAAAQAESSENKIKAEDLAEQAAPEQAAEHAKESVKESTKTVSQAGPEQVAEPAKEAALKEKLVDRQLELLWANGRKQLLNQPFQRVKMPPHQEISQSTQAAHKSIKQ